MEEKICKHCECVLTNEPEYKCYKNPDRTLAEKIIREDIINCTDWEIGAEETIANGMLKFHDQVSSQLEPPVIKKNAEVYICKIKMLGFPFATCDKQKADDWVNKDPLNNYYDIHKIEQ